MKNNFRIVLYLLTFSISSIILFSFTPINAFNKKELLSLLVSVISIIIAILVTYLFSKLFAEKSIRIERKKEIDEFSKKVTYLRRIAFQIRKMYSFWRHQDHNLKAIMDNKFPDLLYEEYRGNEAPEFKKFTYEEISSISEQIYGTDGQAYLALKALEDTDNDFSLYTEFNPQNYSVNDIARYKEYAGSFWYFLDRSDRDYYNFQRVNRYHLNFVDQLYFKITGNQINQNDYRQSLKDLFGSFDEEYFQKHYYLTNLNSNIFPTVFKTNFSNMLVFLTLLLSSLIFYTIQLNEILTYKITLFILSLFISNAIDLIAITYLSIKSELDVKEIFRI
jgi:hypothetical protein